MTKKSAFAQTKKAYPNLKPTRPGGFTLTQDGKGVIVSCHDTDSALVIYHPTDIARLKAMLQMVELKQK